MEGLRILCLLSVLLMICWEGESGLGGWASCTTGSLVSHENALFSRPLSGHSGHSIPHSATKLRCECKRAWIPSAYHHFIPFSFQLRFSQRLSPSLVDNTTHTSLLPVQLNHKIHHHISKLTMFHHIHGYIKQSTIDGFVL